MCARARCGGAESFGVAHALCAVTESHYRWVMHYEVEFHPVGDATRAGDAISIRYFEGGAHKIIIVDGGTDDAGDRLVEHVQRHYGSDAIITHVVSTHPDTDHACGLRAIMKAFVVENLWIHGVWHHAAELLPYFADKRWTAEGVAKAIRDRYPVVEELIELAAEQGASIYEPFQGSRIGPFTVLSPSRFAYLRLVAQFRKTPEADTDQLVAENMLLSAAPKPTLLSTLLEKAASAVSWVDEAWNIELLREGAVTAAENETSTVLFAQFGGDGVLLTGDAGVNALRWSMDFAAQQGLDLTTLRVVQVPHHGSRSNVTPSVLNDLLGPRLGDNSIVRGAAVVSAPKDDEKHPRKMVVNAFRRRGWPVYKTQGNYHRQFSSGYPLRANEVAPAPFDWFGQVEQYD